MTPGLPSGPQSVDRQHEPLESPSTAERGEPLIRPSPPARPHMPHSPIELWNWSVKAKDDLSRIRCAAASLGGANCTSPLPEPPVPSDPTVLERFIGNQAHRLHESDRQEWAAALTGIARAQRSLLDGLADAMQAVQDATTVAREHPVALQKAVPSILKVFLGAAATIFGETIRKRVREIRAEVDKRLDDSQQLMTTEDREKYWRRVELEIYLRATLTAMSERKLPRLTTIFHRAVRTVTAALLKDPLALWKTTAPPAVTTTTIRDVLIEWRRLRRLLAHRAEQWRAQGGSETPAWAQAGRSDLASAAQAAFNTLKLSSHESNHARLAFLCLIDAIPKVSERGVEARQRASNDLEMTVRLLQMPLAELSVLTAPLHALLDAHYRDELERFVQAKFRLNAGVAGEMVQDVLGDFGQLCLGYLGDANLGTLLRAAAFHQGAESARGASRADSTDPLILGATVDAGGAGAFASPASRGSGTEASPKSRATSIDRLVETQLEILESRGGPHPDMPDMADDVALLRARYVDHVGTHILSARHGLTEGGLRKKLWVARKRLAEVIADIVTGTEEDD